MSNDRARTPEVRFADRLRVALRDRGMTQRDLAAEVGLSSATTVSHWLAGRRTPDAATVARVAAVLGVDAGWLLGESDEDGEAMLRRAMKAVPPPGAEDGGAFREAFATSARGLPPEYAADYARLMSFALLAAAWHAEHGWDVHIEVTLPGGRAVRVDGGDVSMTMAPPFADAPFAGDDTTTADSIGDAADVSVRERRRDSEPPTSEEQPPRSA